MFSFAFVVLVSLFFVNKPRRNRHMCQKLTIYNNWANTREPHMPQNIPQWAGTSSNWKIWTTENSLKHLLDRIWWDKFYLHTDGDET